MGGLFMCPHASHARAHLASAVFKENISERGGDRLFHETAEDL